MKECTVCFYLTKLVVHGHMIKCLIHKVTVMINMYNTLDHDNLKSLKCYVFRDNFCYKMFCWGLYNNFHFCFLEINHMYFSLQAPLVSTVIFLVQMNTVCRSYIFLMSMLGVYLSLTRYRADRCKGEELLIQFSNKA